MLKMIRTVVFFLLISGILATATRRPQRGPVLVFCSPNCGGCRLENSTDVDCGRNFNDLNIILRGELREDGSIVDILFALELFCDELNDTCIERRESGIFIPSGEVSCTPRRMIPATPEPPRDPYSSRRLVEGKRINRSDDAFMKTVSRQGCGGTNVNARNPANS